MHLLGITAYAVPWLNRLNGPSQIPLSVLVLVLAVAVAAWTTRSRRPTPVSVLGALLIAAVIGLAPAIVASARVDAILPITPRTAMTSALALALGVVLARPAVRGLHHEGRQSFAAAARSGARAGAWLVLVAAPPLAFAAYLFRSTPHSPEVIFGLVVAVAIVLFGFVAWLTGVARARASAHRPARAPSSSSWPASVRHRQVT